MNNELESCFDMVPSILESPRLKENMRKSFARTVKVGKDGFG